jgi:hypothetical protein
VLLDQQPDSGILGDLTGVGERGAGEKDSLVRREGYGAAKVRD